MKQTARKISCLLNKSVIFGSQAYRHIVDADDVKSRVFNTDVKLLPTGQEIMMLDQKMNQALASNPQLAMFLDTFKIIRIAKEDVKLAEEYYRMSMKKMQETLQAQAMQNQQMTIQGQMQSAQMAEQEKRKSLEMELEIKKRISDAETTNELKKSMVAGLFGIYQKGMAVPSELKPLEAEILQNIAMPLFAENINAEDMMAAQMAQQQQQEGQPQEEGAEQEGQQSPEQEQAEPQEAEAEQQQMQEQQM